MIVEEYMTRSPHTIGYRQSLAAASQMMAEYSIRHLPVLDGGQVVGVVSDRDIAWVEALESFDPEQMPVEEAISREPYAVPPEEPLLNVIDTLHQKRLGSAVIIEGAEIRGVFTTVDALKVLADMLRDGTTYPQVPSRPTAAGSDAQ